MRTALELGARYWRRQARSKDAHAEDAQKQVASFRAQAAEYRKRADQAEEAGYL